MPLSKIVQNSVDTGVAGSGPAFNAYLSNAQSVSSGTWTKILLNAENFDTANCFDSTTNYRFQPNVAGYYQINAACNFNISSSWAMIALYKNGSVVSYGNTAAGTPNGINPVVSCFLQLNGTTDYIELYIYQATGSNQNLGNAYTLTTMQGFLARAA